MSVLTHWDRDKMADFFQTTFSNAFFRMKMFEIWSEASNWQLTSTGLDNYLHQSGDKPSSEPMMA